MHWGHWAETLEGWLGDWFPLLGILVLLVVVWLGMRQLFAHQRRQGADIRYRQQGGRLLLLLVGLTLSIIVAPIGNELRGQLLSLIGLLLSATIALSSTSVMGNLVAGFMLRAVNSFRGGDFIEFRDEFGRVSQRGLLHVEIQNEDSELVTVPNLLLVQEPFSVVRASGTVISAEVSLGYDVDRCDIENALLQAIEQAELQDGFVQIRDLGDFSVLYRASGKLQEAGYVVSARSRLRAAMLDTLHQAGIEIVSPTFMNQRSLEAGQRFIPEERRQGGADKRNGHAEQVLFDKAETTSTVEQLEEKRESLRQDIEAADSDAEKARLEEERDVLQEKLEEAKRRAEEENNRDKNSLNCDTNETGSGNSAGDKGGAESDSKEKRQSNH